MTNWTELTSRAGTACHQIVGWLMWDPAAIERYAALGVPNGAGWIQAWRLAPLGNISPAVVSATTFSIQPQIIEFVLGMWRDVTDAESIAAVRDDAVVAGLDDIAPGLLAELDPLTDDLWRGVDSVHFGARPLFAANRAHPRPDRSRPGLSAWLAANCMRELRGDNHWIACASHDLDDVEVGLLHSAMVDPEEYGDEEWITRSRGADDERVARGWQRLERKGLATDGALNDKARSFRIELERHTDDLTEPAWREVGEAATLAFCEAVDAHRQAFLDRIDATAGPRWMPALRHRPGAG